MKSVQPRGQALGRASLLFLAVLLPLAACGAASSPANREAGAPVPAASLPARPAAPGAASDQASLEQPVPERMIIRNATLSLVVADVDRTLDDLARLATEMGGFVVSSNSEEQGGDRVGQAVIRVPVNRVDEAKSRIKGMATRVRREITSSQDVTEEYVDQDARLRALRAEEDSYLALYKTARSVDDSTKVGQALSRVRQEINRIEGRMKYLERSSALAAITAELTTSAAAQPVQGRGWSAVDTFLGAIQSLFDVLLALASVLIWVVVFLPIWGPVVWLIRRRRRRARAARAPQPPPVQPAPPAQPAPSG